VVEQHDIVVIGGGQAGLAMSAVLSQHECEHVVLERGRVGAWCSSSALWYPGPKRDPVGECPPDPRPSPAAFPRATSRDGDPGAAPGTGILPAPRFRS